MSLRNSGLLLAAWLLPATLVAQQTPIQDGGLFAGMAYIQTGGGALGMTISPPGAFKGGGPYWILLQYAEASVVNPILFKATDSRAKILFILPKKVRGFEEFQGLAGTVRQYPQGCQQF